VAKGVADIVFLIDATGSMDPLMDGLKENITRFIDFLEAGEGQETSPVRDWRARVVGFRDYEVDSEPLVEHPFVRDRSELKRQLMSLEPTGGGDAPESLLDALYKVISIGETGVQDAEDDRKWRERRQALRAVVIFTDAPFKRTMVVPEAKGGTVDDIVNAVNSNRIVLSVFAPEDAGNDSEGYARLAEADKAEWMAVRSGSGLVEYTSDRAHFQETLKQLAKSISVSAEVPTL
jgi:hypothetical protein